MKSKNREKEEIVIVENAIKSLLPNRITAEVTAKFLHISKRKLDSICQKHGWTFLELKRMVISARYKELKSSGLADKSIYEHLGYSSASYLKKIISKDT